MHVLCSQPAGERTRERAADADNEWDTVPSIPRFTHTHYSGRSPSTKRNGHRRLREAAAQHAHRWENDPVQPEMVSLHQGRLSSVDWQWAALEESAPLQRIMMTLDFEFVH